MSFLEKEVGPWSTVCENWRATHEARQKILENTTVHGYFERSPCLKQQLNASLVIKNLLYFILVQQFFYIYNPDNQFLIIINNISRKTFLFLQRIQKKKTVLQVFWK